MTADLYSGPSDRYNSEATAPSSRPARLAIALTPDDNKDVTNAAGANAPCYAKALYVGVSGDLTVVAAGDNSNSGQGTAVTFKNVPVGWFPVQVRRVMATGTAASQIIGLFDQ